MKHRVTLSIASILSLVFSLVSWPATTGAQTERMFVADTGIITLGPNQTLRLTATINWGDGNATATVRFRRMGYLEQDNIYRVVSQSTSDPLTLIQGEGTSIEIPNLTAGVRGVVLSNSPKVRVTAQIIDANTGKVTEVTGLDMEVNVIE